MNLSRLFDHWKISENPFRGEEARHDAVFARVGLAEGPGGPVGGDGGRAAHSEFEKILGELTRPATSVVFGEKGSGKTAIRLQIADRVRAHNACTPTERLFLISYDDLNVFLDQLQGRLLAGGRIKEAHEAFEKIRLVDHMDAILSIGVGRVVNALLPGHDTPPPADLGDDAVRRARQMDASLREDLVLLAGVYDRHDVDGRRTARLRSVLRLPPPRGAALWFAVVWLGWIPAGALAFWLLAMRPEWFAGLWLTAGQVVLGVLGAAWLAGVIKVHAFDRLVRRRMAGKVHRQVRVVPRTTESLATAMQRIDPARRNAGFLPATGSDEVRYELLDKMRRIIAHFGFTGTLVVIDRVDEPTSVNGDPERMRGLIWPLLSSKFLQQERFGMKMLLPIELRYALFKESGQFFQEARLDKQNLVERLSWTGAMLYDLCTARLAACRSPDAGAMSLLDLFDEDVTRQDLVDALDQMHQPRDAFKFLYRCLTEHCSNVTADEGRWRVPKLVLDAVRKQESDRVQQLERGIRPA
ncbi:MAG: hypothetical protein AAF995_01880 [Planctomycetota bacterium]